jgi:branched-chain amino acid transport system ATP-binding protein
VSPLVVENLSKVFGGVRALDAVSFQVSAGERRAFIGSNGAGKTTLFNVINGQLPASSGEIRLFGRTVTGLPTHRRAALGLSRTFQITNLFPKLTVLENMIIAVQAAQGCGSVFYRRVDSYASLLRGAREMLEQWRLWEIRDETVASLSYGTQRQLDMVLALAGKPRVLMLDEPLAGLSASEARLAADFIAGLDRSITVLLIEHDLAAAFRIADTITAMDQGRIIASGTPDEIRGDARLRGIYLRGGAQASHDDGAR